jgi:hypothetical protein
LEFFWITFGLRSPWRQCCKPQLRKGDQKRQICQAAKKKGFEELEEDQVLGRNFEGPWEKECSDEQLDKAFAVFWPSGNVPICADTGLPIRLVENRFWDVIGRLWRATYFKKKASLFDKKLFQRFLNGQVIERKEADWNVSLYIGVCGSLPI